MPKANYHSLVPRFILGLVGAIGLAAMLFQQESCDESSASWAIVCAGLIIFTLIFPENERDRH